VAITLFYLLSAVTVAFGVGVIASKNTLMSVLNLLGAFFCLAGIYLLAGFQFLAATQLLVYVGAIMVLFLFVIMLLDLDSDDGAGGTFVTGRGRLAAIGAAGLLTLVAAGAADFGLPSTMAASDATQAGELEPAGATASLDDIHSLAELLFSRYLLPFEAASLLLLATMIAVILLAKRQRPGSVKSDAMDSWPWKKGTDAP